MIGGFISGGAGTGKAKVDAQDNIILGAYAGTLLSSDDDDNIAIGTNALNSTLVDANNNVAIGTDAGTAITTGDNNICIGNGAGKAINSGLRNTCIGNDAGSACTTGVDAIYIGKDAVAATQANNLVAIGNECLKLIEGSLSNTTAVGVKIADACTGLADQSVYVGYGVLGTTTVSGGNGSQYDTLIGSQAAGSGQYNGNTNCFIGYQTGLNKTTGNYNTLIGGACGSNMIDEVECTLVGSYGSNNFPFNEGYSGYNGLGTFGTGLMFYSDATTMSTYNAAQGDDNTAASVAIYRIPQYSYIYRVSAWINVLGAGTHKYSISMGTASDEAIGDTVAGRVELLGADVGTGITTRSSTTKDSATDIDASTGATEKAMWVSEMSPGTSNFTGWCDTDMYIYITNAGIGNAESDPGTDPRVYVKIEYYGKD